MPTDPQKPLRLTNGTVVDKRSAAHMALLVGGDYYGWKYTLRFTEKGLVLLEYRVVF